MANALILRLHETKERGKGEPLHEMVGWDEHMTSIFGLWNAHPNWGVGEESIRQIERGGAHSVSKKRKEGSTGGKHETGLVSGN